MEDASAVDLDWFWKGWFYTVDNVDIEVSNVKWLKIKQDQKNLEGQVTAQQGNLGSSGGAQNENNPLFGEPHTFELKDSRQTGEFRGEVDNEAIKKRFANKNFYEVTFKNKGGLVMPIIVEFTYKDGTKEIEKIPAEIWRKNEQEVTHMFLKNKEVASIKLDPNKELADTNEENNVFPKTQVDSRFDRFKRNDGN